MSVLVEIYRNKSCICPTELFSLKLWRAVEAACVRTCGKHIWHCSQRLSWVPGFPDLDKLVSKRSRFQSAPTQKVHPESVNIKRDTRDQSPATLEGVAVRSGTYIIKASQFVHQPVELEQVQVPVAQNRPFVDGSSWRGRGEMMDTKIKLKLDDCWTWLIKLSHTALHDTACVVVFFLFK